MTHRSKIQAAFIAALLLTMPLPILADDEAPAKKSDATETAVETPPQTVSDAEAKVALAAFEEGRTLFFQGEYAEAVTKLKQATKADPGKTSYQMMLAKAHRYAKQDAEAIAQFEAILKADPSHVEAAIELAELVDPTKETDRVIAVLQPLLKYKHDYPLYHLLAEAFYEKEDFDQARKYYAEAIKLNNQNGNDHYQLGNIYLAQQRFAKAAQSYEKAGELGLSSGVYHFKLASVYYNLHNHLGKPGAAQVIGGEIDDIKGEFYLLDKVLGEKDRFYVCPPRSAIYQIAKAKLAGVDIFDIHFLEANVWLSARRYSRADAIYASLEEKVAEEDAGLFWYSWAQAALGETKYQQYLDRLDKAIEAEPDIYKATRPEALVTVAQRYQQAGDSAKHVEYLRQAVQASPLAAELHLQLGDAHWIANEKKAAIEQYKLVLELEAQHPDRVRLLNRIRGLTEA